MKKLLHINVMELKPVSLALKHFKICCRNQAVLVEGNKAVSPAIDNIRIKAVNHASFVSHLCFAPMENIHNVAQNLPLGDV